MTKSGVQEACDKIGGQVVLADKVGRTQQAVSEWVKKGYVPLDLVPLVAELSGVDRRRLCDPHILDVIGPD